MWPQTYHLILISYIHGAFYNFKAHYSANEDRLAFLKSLVSGTIVLALKEVSDEQFEVLRCIFESVVGNRNKSTLKALEMCSNSDIHKSLTNNYRFFVSIPFHPA